MRRTTVMWNENEAPVWRWIVTILFSLAAGISTGGLFGVLVTQIPFLQEGSFLAPEMELLKACAMFAGLYISFMLSVNVFCHTTLRSFLFGAGRRPDVKSAAVTGLLYLLSLFLVQLIDLPNLVYDPHPVSLVLFNALFCLLFLWLQTTAEEIFFRVLFLRIPFGNKIPPMKKGLLLAVLSGLFFMSLHLFNPEVTSQSGTNVVLTGGSYFVSGFLLFVSNLLIGGGEGGIVLHFVNNFFCFVFVRMQVTVLETPTLFIDTTREDLGLFGLLAEILAFILPIGYLVLKHRRKGPEQAPEV